MSTLNKSPNTNSTSSSNKFISNGPESVQLAIEPSQSGQVPNNHAYLLSEEPVGDFRCGAFRWHPHFLQQFANKQTFLALFCLTSVLQGVYYTYFVSVLTTIEKLYQIPSKTTGIIMSSTEIGQISGAMLLTYYGGQGHRPRWISSGMIVFAMAALLCSTPHYLFGSQPTSMSALTASTVGNSFTPPPLCHLNNSGSSWQVDDLSCGQESAVAVRRGQVTHSVLAIFFMSLLLIGLGTTAVNTLGIPYIDDNVAPKESPLYFAITIGVRIFGPVCGFLLGSLCTTIPVDFLFGETDLTPSDPNWIGAWWLGLFIVGISLALTSIPMAIFPKRLPQPDPTSYCHQQQQASLLKKERLIEAIKSLQDREANNEDKITNLQLTKLADQKEMSSSQTNGKSNGQSKKPIREDIPTLLGFTRALKRLLSNKILLCRTASSVLHILPISGLYTFLPKYLESQFQLTAGNANIISGLAGILVMGFGVFTSGTFMRKFKPSARFVASWIAFSAIAYVIGMIALMFVGCPNTQFVGLEKDELVTRIDDKSLLRPLECSADCNCPRGRFEPICLNGYTYNSPCIAGCKSFNNATINSEKLYLDCACSSSDQSSTGETIATMGLCSLQCNTLTLYIIIFSITVLIHSTSEVGSMLLTLRCVQPQDKAMALGFLSFATGLFGNVPCPILYGAIVDSTCLFWEEDCGKRGACRMYDSVRFRHLFHGLTALIMFLAFLIDLVVCYKAKEIQFLEQQEIAAQDDENQKDEEPEVKLLLTNGQKQQEDQVLAEGKKNDESVC